MCHSIHLAGNYMGETVVAKGGSWRMHACKITYDSENKLQRPTDMKNKPAHMIRRLIDTKKVINRPIYMKRRHEKRHTQSFGRGACNTLQHTATHCNTLQHTATHCNYFKTTYVYAKQTYIYGGKVLTRARYI